MNNTRGEGKQARSHAGTKRRTERKKREKREATFSNAQQEKTENLHLTSLIPIISSVL